MRQLAALGPCRWCPRCRSAWPGRSDLMPASRASTLAGVDRLAGLGQRVERRRAGRLDAQHLAQRRAARPRSCLDLVARARRSRRTPAPRRNPQHEAHLLGRAGLVDRHGHRTDGQDREVEDRPLVAGRRQDRDPVAGLRRPRRSNPVRPNGSGSAACAHVTSVHTPSTRRWKITWSGSSRSCEKTELTTLSCSPTVNDAGTLNSRTVVALSTGTAAVMPCPA